MSLTAECFEKLSAHIGYFPDSTNIGVIESGDSLYIVDTGSRPRDGESIADALKELYPSSSVKAILNTHSHADHCGGNSKLKEITGCEIFAPFNESRIMEFPETMCGIYWGGKPFDELRKIGYMQLTPSFTDRQLHAEEEIETEYALIKCVSLPGHYFDHMGFLVKDKTDGKTVFFLGDSLFGMNMLKKYWIPFMVDPAEFRDSVQKIENTAADFYIPSHGEATAGYKINALAEMNIMVTLETETLILKTLSRARLTHEELLEGVADFAGIDLKLGQYVLIGSTLKSYLSSLHDRGLIDFSIEDNRMLWKAFPESR